MRLRNGWVCVISMTLALSAAACGGGSNKSGHEGPPPHFELKWKPRLAILPKQSARGKPS